MINGIGHEMGDEIRAAMANDSMILKNINVNVTGYMGGQQIINKTTAIDMLNRLEGDVIIQPDAEN